MDLLEEDNIDKNSEINKVIDMKAYKFPFLQIRLPTHILKELQSPVQISHENIAKELQKLEKNFDREAIPIHKLNILHENQQKEK